jgi:hypothetical protein
VLKIQKLEKGKSLELKKKYASGKMTAADFAAVERSRAKDRKKKKRA